MSWLAIGIVLSTLLIAAWHSDRKAQRRSAPKITGRWHDRPGYSSDDWFEDAKVYLRQPLP